MFLTVTLSGDVLVCKSHMLWDLGSYLNRKGTPACMTKALCSQLSRLYSLQYSFVLSHSMNTSFLAEEWLYLLWSPSLNMEGILHY